MTVATRRAARSRIAQRTTPAARATAPESVSRSMPGSVSPAETGFIYPGRRSVGVRETEDEALGRAWGMKPGSAHQLKLTLPARLADVVAHRRQAGATESLAAYLRPVEAALEQSPRPATTDPQLAAALADCAEDADEARYNAEPSQATARALLRKRAAERLTSLEHDRAIAARWGLTL